ncbi:hypothetical protein ACMGER_03115 [Sphingomonas sp. DT-204]
MIMRTASDLNDKILPDEGAVERGYESWKRSKIERGIEQSKDRSAMIPAEQILRDLNA